MPRLASSLSIYLAVFLPVFFLFACAKSEAATLLTVLLLLVFSNRAALLASLCDVVISSSS